MDRSDLKERRRRGPRVMEARHIDFPGADLSYAAAGRVTNVKVRGYQVGRFAVRLAPQDLQLADTHGVIYGNVGADQWVVDHVPSGLIIARQTNFADAVVVADDASRFSKFDPKYKDFNRLKDCLGHDLVTWLTCLLGGEPVTPGGFRQWWRRKAERAFQGVMGSQSASLVENALADMLRRDCRNRRS